MSLRDNTNLMIIDLEYGGWNPEAYDLANYFNETVLHNAFPLDNGVGTCLENFASDDDIDFVLKIYL